MTARKTTPNPPATTLRSIIDVELGVTMRTESDAAAIRVARDLYEAGITRAERIALQDFLYKVAQEVRFPSDSYS